MSFWFNRNEFFACRFFYYRKFWLVSTRDQVDRRPYLACDGAGSGNRTHITSLEGWGNSLYTIPASYWYVVDL